MRGLLRLGVRKLDLVTGGLIRRVRLHLLVRLPSARLGLKVRFVRRHLLELGEVKPARIVSQIRRKL